MKLLDSSSRSFLCHSSILTINAINTLKEPWQLSLYILPICTYIPNLPTMAYKQFYDIWLPHYYSHQLIVKQVLSLIEAWCHTNKDALKPCRNVGWILLCDGWEAKRGGQKSQSLSMYIDDGEGREWVYPIWLAIDYLDISPEHQFTKPQLPCE